MARPFAKRIFFVCALLAACSGDPKKDKVGDTPDDDQMQEDMDAAVEPGLVYDEAGNVLGISDDAGHVLNEAGNVIAVFDDAGNLVTGGGDGSYAFEDGAVPYPVNPAGQVMCGSAVCKCSDGIDNDEPKDGLIDLADPECAAAWDNDESSLATGISGDNRDEACQDCFFDGNSGSGNDGCYLPSSCIRNGTASSGQGTCNTCEQTAKCQNFCKAFAPNGCDCFGCCEVRVAGTIKHLMLGAQCDIAADGTLTGSGCNECVQNTTCINTCGDCELCAGKTVADLPAKCFTQTNPDGGTGTGNDGGTGTGNDGGTGTGNDGGSTTPPPPAYQCENGEQVCGAGLPDCPYGDICSFGCCIRSPILF